MSEIDLTAFGRFTVQDVWNTKYQISLNKLYYVFDGYAYYNGRKLIKNHLYVFHDKPGNPWKTGENFDHLYFNFFITPVLIFDDVIDIDLTVHQEIQALIFAISDIYQNKNVHPSLGKIAKSFLEILLSLVNEISPIRNSAHPTITKILQYIDTCPNENISVTALATKAHMDRFYLIKLFKSAVGKTPYQYIRDLRLSRSVEKLKSGKSIAEAAQQAGFSSEASFSNAFKKRFNIRPSEFQRYAKQDNMPF